MEFLIVLTITNVMIIFIGNSSSRPKDYHIDFGMNIEKVHQTFYYILANSFYLVCYVMHDSISLKVETNIVASRFCLTIFLKKKNCINDSNSSSSLFQKIDFFFRGVQK